ncbi:MAG: YIP1 family protein [Bacillota bacterium]
MINNGENSPGNTGSTPPVEGAAQVIPEEGKGVPGMLELIYGILFDPVGTFRRTAHSPPLGRTLAVFSLVKIMTILVGGYFLSLRMMNGSLAGFGGLGIGEAIEIMAPVVAAMVLVYEYLKWFVYSGILYLLAELAGGRGKAAGVLTATGLASLPALLILPVQILAAVFGGKALSGVADVLIWLAVMIWGAVLVVIGLRETQQLSTGRAVMVALTPALGLIIIFILAIVLLAGIIAPLFDPFK